jgi:VWFA-related protein
LSIAAQDLVIHVNLRMVDVLVESVDGYPVLDLNAEEFEVLENGNALPVSHVSVETGPVAVGLVVDRSSSIKPVKANIDAGVSSVLATLRPDDQVLLMTFSGPNKLNVDLTTSHQKILSALRREKLGYGSRFYDVLSDALQRVSPCKLENRVLIVFSDGADHFSRRTLEQVIALAAISNVPIYFFGYVGDDSLTGSRQGQRRIREQFDQLAAMTGGKTCFAASLTDCAAFARRIFDRTRHRYRLGFYSAEPFTAPSEVQVKTRRPETRVRLLEADYTKLPL